MKERYPLSPDEHLRIASDALSVAGIPHGIEDLKYVSSGRAVVGSGVDGGSLDVRVRSRIEDSSYGKMEEVYRSPPSPTNDLNGLLCNDTVQLGGTLERPGGEPLYYETDILTHSTPDRLNEVQRALGRQPGINALRFETAPGESQISLDVWVPPFTRQTVLTADPLANWFDAAHDLSLTGHTMTWLHSNGKFSGSIAEQAAKLIETHGPAIFLPKGQRPQSVDRFADGLEFLPFFTIPVVEHLARVALAAENRDHSALSSSLSDLGVILDKDTIGQIWKGKRLVDLQDRMQSLGLIQADPGSVQAKPEIAGLVADRLDQMVKTFLTVDEIQPRSDLTLEQQTALTAALQEVGRTAVMAQEMGVERSSEVLLSLSPERARITAEQLLERADSQTPVVHDTYMTSTRTADRNETVRNQDIPGQERTAEPTSLHVDTPRPLTQSPLEVILDQQAELQRSNTANEAAQLQQELLHQQQQQALAAELNQNSRDIH